MKIKNRSLVFLVAFGFSILHNWPVLLHFANILLGLDHFKIGFAISIPICCLGSSTEFCIDAVLDSVFRQTFLRAPVHRGLNGELRHDEISGDL